MPNQAPGGYANAGAPAENTASDSGPVRLARIAYVRGEVSWRPDTSTEFAPAADNLPLRQGAQVWVQNGGRTDIQFDDGSDLRLGNGALVTLKALYSDAQGEFTQITIQDGLATLATRHDHSVYQIDAPVGSVVTSGLAKCRIGASRGLEVAVQRGQCTVEDQTGKASVEQGQYLYLADASATLTVRSLPGQDSWDRWNDDRDRYIYDDMPTYHHVPANIALVAGELDSYGSWRDDARYGYVWVPRPRHAHWRPYSDGHWCWVNPYGWTWIDDDPWGWAPYHYGTWVDESYGWAWCPGPVQQYWSPAVVSFSYYNDSVCWAPLAPFEVHYPPTLAVGFGGGNWSVFFSIGQAGCYYPSGPSYCVGQPFDNVYVNRVTYVNNATYVTNVYNNTMVSNRYLSGSRFVPYYARHGGGATLATVAAFAGRGGYRPAPNGAAFFARGRVVGAPPPGRAPTFGPPAARPTRLALTPTRSFQPNVRPPAAIARRAVFQPSAAGSRPGSFAAARPAAGARPGSFAARPAPRSPGSFTGPGNRTAARPNAGPTSAFNARNMAAAAAANRARADLGMAHGSRPGSSGRPSGSFAPAQRRTAGAAPAMRPGSGSAPATRRGAGSFASQPRVNGNSAPQRRTAGRPAYQQRSGGNAAPQRRTASRPAYQPRFSGNSTPQRRTVSRPTYQPRSGGNSAPQRRQVSRPAYQPRFNGGGPGRQGGGSPAPERRAAPPQFTPRAPVERRAAPPQFTPRAPVERRAAPPQFTPRAPQERQAPPAGRPGGGGQGGGRPAGPPPNNRDRRPGGR